MLDKLRTWAEAIKKETHALALAAADRRTPWYAKLLVFAIVAYAASPIDLIPDIIPILGYLDDLLIVPAGIVLAVRMIPPEVMTECRSKADEPVESAAAGWAAAALIVFVWILSAAVVGGVVYRIVSR